MYRAEGKNKRSAVLPEEFETFSPLKPTNMCYSEKTPDVEARFQTRSLAHSLAGPLHMLGCAIIRVVAHLRRQSVPRPATCPQSSPFTPSGIQSPPSLGDDLLHQYHFHLAQQLHPFLSPICNWLKEDDVQIVEGRPTSAGGFADLWRGSLDTHQVAIKSYRRYLSFDLSRVFLVRVSTLIS